MGLKGFLLVGAFLILGLTMTSAQDQECCQKKVVTAPPEYAGTFTYVRKFDGTPDSNCNDACIYSKDGAPGEEYCFKAVDKDAATIDDQCGATSGPTSAPPTGPTSAPPTGPTSAPPTGPTSAPPTGPTSPAPTGPTSAPSSTAAADPAGDIKAANEEIAATNVEIEAESEKTNTASSASTVVDGITNALASGTRNKRQSDSSTMSPITQCSVFDTKFKDLLSNLKELDGDNADDKIPQIKELVRILNEALPKLSTTLCSQAEKQQLIVETAVDVQTAKEKTKVYKEKKEKKIQDLVVKVQVAQEKIKVSNEKLVASGSTKIPAVTLPIIFLNFTVANPFSYTPHFTPTPTRPISPGGTNGQGSSPGGTNPATGGSTPGGSSPGGSSPGGSSPGGSSPGGSSPGGSSQGGTSPGGSSPGGSSPGGSSPGGSSPGGSSPGGSSPGGTSPGGSSPGGSSPGGSSPGGTSPGGTSPGGSSPGGSSPGGSSPGGTSPASGPSPGPSSSPGTSPRPSTTRGPGRLNKHFKDFKKFHH